MSTPVSRFNQFVVALLVVTFAGCGGVQVMSVPAGAEIYVDGMATGKHTPTSVSLDSGEHTITVKAPGFEVPAVQNARSYLSVGKIIWTVLLLPIFIFIHPWSLWHSSAPKKLTFVLTKIDRYAAPDK